MFRSMASQACLFFEGQSSLIDLYEMLVHSVQAIASARLCIDERNAARRPLRILLQATLDSRLRAPLWAFGELEGLQYGIDRERAQVIEAYSIGDYERCATLGAARIQSDVHDIALLVLVLKAHIRTGRRFEPRDGVLTEVVQHVLNVLSFGHSAYASAHALMTLSDRFYGQAWAVALRAAVLFELREETETFPPLWLRDIYARDPHFTPFSTILIIDEARGEAIRAIVDSGLFPATVAVLLAVMSGAVSETAFCDRTRQLTYLARHALASGNATEALRFFGDIGPLPLGQQRLRVRAGEALASLLQYDLRAASTILVGAFLENPHTPLVLPIARVVNALGEASSWPDNIELPLLLDLYQEFVGRDKVSQLRYCFERFQTAHAINTPADLITKFDELGPASVIAYLERVWRPETMRQTLLYDGTLEIEEARVKVCQALVTLNPHAADKYVEEIKSRIKQLEIAQGTTLIQQSKVYVDIDFIKKTLRSKLGESYARYKFLSANRSQTDERLVNLLVQSLKSGHESIAKVLSRIHLLEPAASTEADAQFVAIFSEVTSEFLRGDHGLNAYLSTRVRHGALSNTLRKPVEDENLVTAREERTGAYVRNLYWTADDHLEKKYSDQLAECFENFSTTFDAIVDNLKDKLLQIRVYQELVPDRNDQQGLFVYSSSYLERKLIQEYDAANEDIDQLIGYCIEILWEKTDENLKTVRKVVGTDIRFQLMSAFDSLSAKVGEVYLGFVPGNLENSIARARTNTQNQIALVSSWFQRSEVYDRHDYGIDLPIQIAVSLMKNTISGTAQWDGLLINTTADGQLPGRTLDGMVDVFSGLLENAVKRSRLQLDSLRVTVDATLERGLYTAKVVNNIDRSRVTARDRELLSEIRQSLLNQDGNRRAQIEGRSGIHKIWLTINSPGHIDPTLAFDIVDDRFEVIISFHLPAETSDENLDH
jgi:DNA-binding transcriptional ArsR family regulator